MQYMSVIIPRSISHIDRVVCALRYQLGIIWDAALRLIVAGGRTPTGV